MARRPAKKPAPAPAPEPVVEEPVDDLYAPKEPHTPIVADRDVKDPCPHCGRAEWLDDGNPGRICSGCGRRAD